MLSLEERIAIDNYKRYEKKLPKAQSLRDLWYPEYDFTTNKDKIDSLNDYCNGLYKYTKTIRKCAEARQYHKDKFITNEDPNHQYWREGLFSIVRDCEEKYDKYKAYLDSLFTAQISEQELNIPMRSKIPSNINTIYAKIPSVKKIHRRSKPLKISEAEREKRKKDLFEQLIADRKHFNDTINKFDNYKYYYDATNYVEVDIETYLFNYFNYQLIPKLVDTTSAHTTSAHTTNPTNDIKSLCSLEWLLFTSNLCKSKDEFMSKVKTLTQPISAFKFMYTRLIHSDLPAIAFRMLYLLKSLPYAREYSAKMLSEVDLFIKNDNYPQYLLYYGVLSKAMVVTNCENSFNQLYYLNAQYVTNAVLLNHASKIVSGNRKYFPIFKLIKHLFIDPSTKYTKFHYNEQLKCLWKNQVKNFNQFK